MYLNWNVNASEQECQVQLYNAVSGINIQYALWYCGKYKKHKRGNLIRLPKPQSAKQTMS